MQHIDICVCTFRRASLETALLSLGALQAPPGTTLRIIVADNDDTPSAKPLVDGLREQLPLDVLYVHAPSRNISIARNACLDNATGDWVAFFDDDETAPPDWLQRLFEKALSEEADAVFGPAMAIYSDDAPVWIRRSDFHSNVPAERNGIVQTGHTCNALVRRTATSFTGQRFLLEKGRSGGEDTEFFFRAWKAGGKLAIAPDAPVYEQVDPARLNFKWIRTRKFRSGITYGRHSLTSHSVLSRASLLASAATKILISTMAGVVFSFSRTRRNFWFLRAAFHAGVLTSGLSVKEQEIYGEPAKTGSPK